MGLLIRAHSTARVGTDFLLSQECLHVAKKKGDSLGDKLAATKLLKYMPYPSFLAYKAITSSGEMMRHMVGS